MKQAIKLDEKWADSHYWYGGLLTDYYDSLHRPHAKKSHFLERAKNALLTAQRLDANMSGSCARMIARVAQRQGRPAEALKYLDLWVKLQSQYAQSATIQNWRQALVSEIKAGAKQQ